MRQPCNCDGYHDVDTDSGAALIECPYAGQCDECGDSPCACEADGFAAGISDTTTLAPARSGWAARYLAERARRVA